MRFPNGIPRTTTTTMSGRTSDAPPPAHAVELVERHTIDVPHGSESFDADVVAGCREAAMRWQAAHGISVPLSHYVSYDDATGPRHGVSWEVVIGRAEGPADGPEQWRWSARWQHWLAVSATMRGNALRIPYPPNGR